MNSPLCRACCRNFCATLFSALERFGGADDELNRQADAARQRRRLERGDAEAGDLPISCCIIGCNSLVVRARWSHGFSTMPPIFWPGTSSWNTCSVSGSWRRLDRPAAVQQALLQRGIRRGDRRRMMTPWSSCGASSVFALL